jgi:hypothetical protein
LGGAAKGLLIRLSEILSGSAAKSLYAVSQLMIWFQLALFWSTISKSLILTD